MATKEGKTAEVSHGIRFDSPVSPNAYVSNPLVKGQVVSPSFERFYHDHRKAMWDLTGIDYIAIDGNKITDHQVEGLRGAMLVESHNPVYAARLLEYNRSNHQDASFATIWAYEEMHHYEALRASLLATEKVDPTELASELVETRAGEWGDQEARSTPVQNLLYTDLQELVTGIFYKRFAKKMGEPVIKDLLQVVGKDEYRHHQWYHQRTKEELAVDRTNRIDEVDDALLNFVMPGPAFIIEYVKYGEAMSKSAGIEPGDFVEVGLKISDLVGKRHLLSLATKPSFQHKLSHEWGLSGKELTGVLTRLALK